MTEDVSGAVSVADDCAGSPEAAAARRTGSRVAVSAVLLLDPDSSIHAPDAKIRTAISQISLDGKYLAAAFAGATE